jgi:heme/copper-type cytochrome/quinol oxidase subunit 3
MKHEEFKKLKNDIQEKNFFNNYRVFSKLSFFLSYVGNLFSILFAYFFLFEIASSAVLEPTPSTMNLVAGGVILVLFTVELSKRFIFDKFSQSFIKDKFRFKNPESKILGLISIGLIAVSFYFSLNGAQDYADKDDDLKKNVQTDVTVYKDSLTNKYATKITSYDDINKKLYTKNNQYDSIIALYEARYLELGTDSWQERQEKNRIKGILKEKKDDKKTNLAEIDKNEIKIKNLKKERDEEVALYESKQSEQADATIEKNKDNPFIFIMFSTVIEFVILFGVFFINYYQVRSLKEYEEKIKKDPRYKQFNLWNELITALYSSDTQIGDLLPYKAESMKLLKANNLDISSKEYDDAMRMFTHLEVLKKKGNKKAINLEEEEARIKIKDHFKID